MEVSQKQKEFSYYPGVSLLGKYPNKSKPHTAGIPAYISLLFMALFPGPCYRISWCPPADEWIKMHIYTMEYYSAIQKDELHYLVENGWNQESPS